MADLANRRMTVDEYLAWATEQSGRYELDDGTVYAMSPESTGHAIRKVRVYTPLEKAIRAKGLPCHALPDGMTVRIDRSTAYEPDALVYCGQKLPTNVIEVPNPVIVVEVRSPSTGRFDALTKLPNYFRLPSLHHCLIVEPNMPLIIHHARAAGDTLLTRIVREGTITLDPPGIEIAMADIYSD